jgi:hypothetical protein
MSHLDSNVVIPVCLPAVLMEDPVGATLCGDSHRESFLLFEEGLPTSGSDGEKSFIM